MKRIGLISILLGLGVIFAYPQNFFLDENGVTIKCENCQPGDTGTVNGILYEAVDRDLLIQRRDEDADLTRLCTSLVTDMSDMFLVSTFNQDIGSWDVSNVIDMSGMFAGVGSTGSEIYTEFNQDISSWNVSNVKDMSGMFYRNKNFDQDIGNWDVSNVTDMSWMFWISTFNQDIGNWDVSNLTDMFHMFAESPFNQDIGNWDVSNVINMIGTFWNNGSFNQDLSGWCVENFVFEPEDFAEGCPLQPDYYPVWGTCPNSGTFIYSNTSMDLSFYPNPTNTILTIETNFSDRYNLEITFLNGQLILSKEMNGTTHQLDLSSFQKGVYFITIRSKDFVTTRKIVKL